MDRDHLEDRVADFYPGYFAFVMATGIISVATYEFQMLWIAWGLFSLNVAGYLGVWFFFLVRLLRYPRRVFDEFTDHRRGAVYFTAVAATCVLGIQVALLAKLFTLAIVLWSVGAAFWFGLMYTFFTAVTVRPVKPDLEKGINGNWLNLVVSTQSVSALGTCLAPHQAAWLLQIQFVSLCMYLLGCLLYILLIALILYRILFFTLHPKEFTPPYWIDMGAEAITALAGATWILSIPPSSLFYGFVPFVAGFTLFFWVTGTWWVPLLTILTIWRHGWKRDPVEYTPRYWSLVFPLGTYAAGTYYIAKAFKLDFLDAIARGFIYVALLAWLLAFAGMMRALRHGRLGVNA